MSLPAYSYARIVLDPLFLTHFDSKELTSMSTQLLDSTTTDVRSSPVLALPASTAHLPVLDRVALRLGLWLLLRSARRAQRHTDHSAHTHRHAVETARAARELATLRAHLLSPRP
ncbi:hypothetical protein [Microbacterium sp. SLBN-146]|uniref:hypothetical protein n=1 Tax=Microbacterium sp. SLBN-146 TaxID=2768457 RepID=UPI00114ED5E9|nr:hypothetical protein [Microbacterium sp. SLBN-146]TQJ31916.1 hypothetical protein FBY39_2405 [Microbacterium sp. SLBN-146]